ncbi:MAG: T9SS type A sorting domain-containing protein [Bacteroidetes bacterium]|nr:T9SS type A sorting domain-containing protein [Bacteroidota bacterium]
MNLIKSIILLVFLSIGTIVPAQAVHLVTNELDNGPGSLRYLISLAEQGDTIHFDNSVKNVALTSGQIQIDKSVSIVGNSGNIKITRDTTSRFRIFDIGVSGAGIKVIIRNLDIMNGITDIGDSETGGGIRINSQYDSVFLIGCNIRQNQTGSPESLSFYVGTGNGGGIMNNGFLSMDDCRVADNLTGTPFFGGNTGAGGGIFNAGRLILTDCSIEFNTTGLGCFWAEESGAIGGTGGNGGGIANTGSLLIISSNIADNLTGAGGTADAQHASAIGGNGGAGGGIFNLGTMELLNDRISGNKTGNGGNANGWHEFSFGGDGGKGGGCYNTGTCRMVNCFIQENESGEGELTSNESGNGGNGGGFYNNHITKIINCLFSANKTGNNPAGSQSGYPGNGAGIFNSTPSVSLDIINSTISGNTIPLSCHSGQGGGLFNESNYSHIQNSIFYNNSVNQTIPSDIKGLFISRYSLIGTVEGSFQHDTTCIYYTDPLFISYPYDFRLQSGSPAINAANPDTANLGLPLTDIGLRPRIVRDTLDIGAYERQIAENDNIYLQPEHITFPTIEVGSFASGNMNLIITGEHPAIIDSITSSDDFRLQIPGQTSWSTRLCNLNLPPGAHPVNIRFQPFHSGSYEYYIQLYYHDDSVSKTTGIYVSGAAEYCNALSGDILQDTTWQDCITLVGNVKVKKSFTLHIAPGTKVKAAGPYEIQVDGMILASGTASQPIEFSGISLNDTLNISWNGIHLRKPTNELYSTYSFLDYCTIRDVNKQTGSGAIYLEYNHLPGLIDISNCQFENNRTTSPLTGGAAIFKHDGEKCNLSITNTIFRNNSAILGGGAYFSDAEGTDNVTTITNSLFNHNSCASGNAGSALAGAYSDKLTNCTFFGNPYPSITGNNVIIQNCLFWPSEVNSTNLVNAQVSYSNIGMGYPDFADTSQYDYHLLPASYAIDAGNPATITVSADLDGNPRISGPIIDLGCFEYQRVYQQLIEVLPESLDLYTTLNKEVFLFNMVIRNKGIEPLTIDSICLPAGFWLNDSHDGWANPLKGLIIGPNSLSMPVVRFLPDKDTVYSGYITFYSNSQIDSILSISVHGHVSPSGISDQEATGNDFTISPNPTTGFVSFCRLTNVKQLEIADMKGIVQLAIPLWKPKETATVDLRKLNKGMYLVKLIFDDKIVTRKLILQ